MKKSKQILPTFADGSTGAGPVVQYTQFQLAIMNLALKDGATLNEAFQKINQPPCQSYNPNKTGQQVSSSNGNLNYSEIGKNVVHLNNRGDYAA